MLKKFLLVMLGVFLLKAASGQRNDTLIFYYQNGRIPVNSLERADYFRIILPPDSGDVLNNVKEYYKNGKIKFVGKFDPELNVGPLNGRILCSGDCISYYPNGKKQNISHYNRGKKDGKEYLYYPNGQIYCILKNVPQGVSFSPKALKWECYDLNGAMTCSNGNGQWIIYDDDYKNVSSRGLVRGGLMDGDWHGTVWDVDSIRYVLTYSKDNVKSGIGYDKAGTAYSFTKEREPTRYKSGPITFIEVFKGRLRLPKNAAGKKMSIDSVAISFTVEKDGHTTDFDAVGNVSPELKNALADAMAKCQDRIPGRFYGIPYRTRIMLPLNFYHGYSSHSYDKTITFKEQVLGF